jgi:hypothetical protein
MKKIPVLLTSFLLCTSLLYSQQKEQKYFVELSAGPSFPIGKFADKSKEISEGEQPAGLAKLGLNAQLSLGYYIKENVGLLFSSGFSIHKQDASSYEDYYKENLNAGGGIRPTSVAATTKSWQILKLMAGGFLVTPLTEEEELVLVTKITIGACKTAVPGYSTVVDLPGGMNPTSTTMDKISLPWAFCYQVSMGVKYKLNDKLHLLFDVNSFNANPQKTYKLVNPVSGQNTVKEKYKLGEVNALVGIGMSF